MKFVEYPDQELMMIDLAGKLAGELGSILRHEERVTFAVPGGTTPGPIFDALCAVDLDWDRVTVLLTDERWVPEEAERSNTRLVREHLLTDHAAAARFLPFYTPGQEPEAAIGALTEAVEQVLPVSVLLLGMGEDMHTASLFPGADRLNLAMREDAPSVMVQRVPGQPEPRITLTAGTLKDAMNIHLVITGADKRAALERALSANDPLKAPVSAILKNATVHWAE